MLREMASRTDATQLELVVEVKSVVEVDQFYGIEIGEFPARIAATALWMMDHIMNNRLSLEFGRTYARIPIEKSPHVHCADALEIDWADVLLPDEVLIRLRQSAIRRSQVPVARAAGTGAPSRRARRQRRYARLRDRLVHPRWRLRATGATAGRSETAADRLRGDQLDYAGRAGGATLAVAVRPSPPGDRLRSSHLRVGFGRSGQGARARGHHRAGRGRPRATRQAPVHLRGHQRGIARRQPRRDHAYLFDGGSLSDPHLVVREEGRPINGLVQLLTGSQPIDDGHYIFNVEERLAFLDAEPAAEPFLRPFVGAREYLQGGKRWILTLHDAPPATLARLPSVRSRIAAVRAYRRTSKRTSTLKLADTPTLWQVNVLPTAPFLVLPEVSSERREYLPIGWLEPPAIPSNKLRLLPDATLTDFALLTSATHMAWMRAVTGRMKSDYMYSVGVVYNTFPLPPGFTDADTSALDPLAQAVLDARAAHPGADAGRPVRPGPDATQPPEGTSRAGSRCRSALPPKAVHVGTRTRRALVRPLRAHASPAHCRSRCQAQSTARE